MKAKNILTGLVFSPFKPSSPQDGAERISSMDGSPEIVYIMLDNIHPKNFGKKAYYYIHSYPVPSWLDQWTYEHLVKNEEFAEYLQCYRGKKGVNSDNIDQYILKKHYYPEALSILKKKKNFDLDVWTKPRHKFSYTRKSNLFLKGGEALRIDFRNIIVILFTVRQKDQRSILAIGGGGGSGQREFNTLFTAVYYLLSKKQSVRNHFMRYNGNNEYEYIRTYRKLLLTDGFGCNYTLDKNLKQEIEQNSICMYRIPELKKQFGRKGGAIS